VQGGGEGAFLQAVLTVLARFEKEYKKISLSPIAMPPAKRYNMHIIMRKSPLNYLRRKTKWLRNS
jgi:hypothetical protein